MGSAVESFIQKLLAATSASVSALTQRFAQPKAGALRPAMSAVRTVDVETAADVAAGKEELTTATEHILSLVKKVQFSSP